MPFTIQKRGTAVVNLVFNRDLGKFERHVNPAVFIHVFTWIDRGALQYRVTGEANPLIMRNRIEDVIDLRDRQYVLLRLQR